MAAAIEHVSVDMVLLSHPPGDWVINEGLRGGTVQEGRRGVPDGGVSAERSQGHRDGWGWNREEDSGRQELRWAQENTCVPEF